MLQLRARDVAGNWSEQVGFAYTVANALTLRDLYPFPSPATQSTAFTFRVSHCGTAIVDLYSLSGRLVRRLAEDVEPPFASIPWDLTDEDGGRVAAGVYLYVLRVEGEDRTLTFRDARRILPQWNTLSRSRRFLKLLA